MAYFDVNLDLTMEDEMIRDSARKFAREVVRPTAIALDRMTSEEVVAPKSPIWGFLRQAYDLGYHRAGFPRELGGLGFTPLQMHLLAEELNVASFGLASLVLLSSWPFAKILQTGKKDLIDKWVIPFINCTDGSMTAGWAVVEPDRGSDQFGMGEPFYADTRMTCRTRARLDGDEWVISGQKAAWVSGGPIASHCMANVQIDDSKGLAGGGVCILPLDLPGVSRGRPLNKLGLRDMPQCELMFDDVRIPKSDMFVLPDDFSQWVLNSLGFGNTGVSIGATAIARAAFEEALAYAKVRVQGGQPLIEQYSMKIRIARMFAKVEAARAFSRAVNQLHARVSPPLCEYAYAAKVFCTETAREVVDEAVQIHGACGVTKEYFIEKLFRDARPLTILDGENDVLARLGGNILKDTFPRGAVNKL